MALGEYAATLRGLSRDVRLYLVTPLLLGLTVWGGITAVLSNLYLVRLGYGTEFVGLLNSVAAFSMAVFALPSAALGRRYGCRRVMVVGLAVGAAGNAVVALAGLLTGDAQAAVLVGATALANCGFDLYMVNSNPLLMSLTSPAERSHAYSLQTGFSPVAAFVGSLVGGALPSWLAPLLGVGTDRPEAYRAALLIAVAILALAVPAGLAIREPAPEAAAEAGGRLEKPARAPWGLIGLLSAVVLLHSGAEGISRTFVNVYLDVGLRLPTPEIGGLLSLAQIVAFPAALITPLLVARWGSASGYVRAALGMGLLSLPLALVASPPGATLGYVGVIALGCIARPCLVQYQYELVPARWWTTLSGATTLSFGLSNTFTAYAAGSLISSAGFASAFLLGGALTAAAGLLFWGTSRGLAPVRAA